MKQSLPYYRQYRLLSNLFILLSLKVGFYDTLIGRNPIVEKCCFIGSPEMVSSPTISLWPLPKVVLSDN
jgi:hypothetical protein